VGRLFPSVRSFEPFEFYKLHRHPGKLHKATSSIGILANYTKFEYRIPMRDGVKLGAQQAQPISHVCFWQKMAANVSNLKHRANYPARISAALLVIYGHEARVGVSEPLTFGYLR
jgi:hypothetical protein